MSEDPTSLVVFVYDFSHRKSHDFLVRLYLERRDVSLVLAAPRVELGIAPPTQRTTVRTAGGLAPRVICERMGIPYVVAPHNSAEALRAVEVHGANLGLVAGARILSRDTIQAVGGGIVNLHPGLIPEVRGLDALLWAVVKDVPLGVTAHCIDERVDAGRILLREEVSVRFDDTVFDLSERLYQKQLEMLGPALDAAIEGRVLVGADVGTDSVYNRKMDAQTEAAAIASLPGYLSRHSSID